MTTLIRKRGRPAVHSVEEQWQRVTLATKTLLAQHEMDRHSMTEIARLAGMSKRTLYALVTSKEVLISRVIQHTVLPALDLLDVPVADTQAALDTLELFLLRWMQAAFSNSTINILRLAMDERKNFPGIAQSYVENGAEFMGSRFTAWLRTQVTAQRLKIDDPVLTSDMLTSSLVPRSFLGTALGCSPTPSGPYMRKRVKTVMAFCGLTQAHQLAS